MKKKYVIIAVLIMILICTICIMAIHTKRQKSLSTYVESVGEEQYHGEDTYDENYIKQSSSITGTLTFVGENQTTVEYMDEAGMLYYLDKKTGTITQVDMLDGDEGLEE